MGSKIKSLGYEMQRVIDLGLIDHWLRGLCDLVPRPLARYPRDIDEEFNTHQIAFDCADTIGATHIQTLTGYRQLLTNCSQQGVAVDMAMQADGHLEIHFKPEHEFKSSAIFGASYHNVLPTLFGIKPGKNH